MSSTLGCTNKVRWTPTLIDEDQLFVAKGATVKVLLLLLIATLIYSKMTDELMRSSLSVSSRMKRAIVYNERITSTSSVIE